MRKMHKKGQTIFSNIGGLAIGIATVCLVLVIAFLVTSKTQTQIQETDGSYYVGGVNGSLAFNASEAMKHNTYSIIGWIGLVVIVAIGVLILGLVRQIRQ